MRWTAVPETAVNKNRKFVLAKDKIRLAGQALIASPTRDPVRSEQCYELQFS